MYALVFSPIPFILCSFIRVAETIYCAEYKKGNWCCKVKGTVELMHTSIFLNLINISMYISKLPGHVFVD